MKNLLIVLFFFFFVSSLFAQYVEQKKEKQEEVQQRTETVETKDSVVTSSEKQVFLNTSKEEVKEVKVNYKYKKLNNLNSEDNMKYWYPVSQYEGYLGYVHLKNIPFEVNGGNFYVVVRQNPNVFDKLNQNTKTWGLYAEGGQYQIKIDEKKDLTTDIKVQQIGGGISFAMTRNKPGWNAFVFNFGVTQEIENGTSGLFEWRQTDILMSVTGWIDLTRAKDKTFFSRSNFSFFWKRPLSTRQSALYQGQVAKREIWDKETIGCEFQQTMLMFYLTDNLGMHMGLNLGYQHFSAGPQDWYSPGAFIEIHNKYYKVGQFLLTHSMKPHDRSQRGSYTTIKFSVDAVQLAKSIFF